MTINELGAALSNLYHNAPNGDKVAMIHIFGIKHAKELTATRFNKVQVAKTAGIPESYFVEINKGIKLAKYVAIKNNI
jgi:5-methylcytosine-specific restriction protein B